MKALVIGFGSIGQRHCKILRDLGFDVAAVTKGDSTDFTTFKDLGDAVRNHRPEYAVIASPTAKHISDLSSLRQAGYSGKVLVEKPLFSDLKEGSSSGANVFVGYQLRFDSVLTRLAQLIKAETVISVNAYVGQHLSTWRPGRDYRQVYSAQKNQGGGALRDLSHELDFLTWLFGSAKSVSARGGKRSSLEIDSDDFFTISIETTKKVIVTVELNYFDRIGQRYIVVNTEDTTYRADLVSGTLQVNKTTDELKRNRDDAFTEMHKDVISDIPTKACRYSEGIEVMRLIEACELSSEKKKWVEL